LVSSVFIFFSPTQLIYHQTKVSGSAPVKAVDHPSVEEAPGAKFGQYSGARPVPTLVESISAALASTKNPLSSLSKSEMNRIIFEVVSGDGFAELVRAIYNTLSAIRQEPMPLIPWLTDTWRNCVYQLEIVQATLKTPV
jgi:hypothetical protein